jgi:hypothetical protein
MHFSSAFELSRVVLNHRAKVSQNMYNDLEVYKEETSRHTLIFIYIYTHY